MAYVHDTADLTSEAASGYTFGDFTCSANYEHSSADYKAWRCFDHAVNYYWASNHNPSVGDEDILVLDAGAGKSHVYTGCKIAPLGGATPYGIVDFKIEGSNDGSSYTTLKTVTGETWAADTTKSYAWSNTTAYRYLRLKISKANASLGQTGVGELEVFASSPFRPPIMIF